VQIYIYFLEYKKMLLSQQYFSVNRVVEFIVDMA